MAALFAALLCLPIVLPEIGLRVFGYGHSTRFFTHKTIGGTEYSVSNPGFYQQFFGIPLDRGMWAGFEFHVPRIKEENACRIFVVGESAANGMPPDMACAFWRILEKMLKTRYPGVRFEFYCAALPGVNSHVLRAATDACARAHPDLFVVYMGNNELCGPLGPMTPLSASPLWGSSAIRANIALSNLRLVQWVSGRNRTPSLLDVVIPDNMWEGTGRLDPESPKMLATYGLFDINLEAICAAAHNAGAGTVLCTVGSNLRHCGPFASGLRPGLSDGERDQWNAAFDEGKAREEQGDCARAREAYDRCAALDGSHAELQFRMGRCAWAMGDYGRAKEHFVRARDCDWYMTRANGHINASIRETAARRTRLGVRLADAEQALADNAAHGTPGREFFFDNVHLTFAGNYVVARAAFEQVVHALPERIKAYNRPDAAIPSVQECERLFALTPLVKARHADAFSHALDDAMRAGILEFGESLALLREQRARLGAEAGPDAERAQLEAYHAALGADEGDFFLRSRWVQSLQAAGRIEEACREAGAMAERFPARRDARRYWGELLSLTGRHAEAERVLRGLLATYPDDAEGWVFLGGMLQIRGDWQKARAAFEAAIAEKPADAVAHVGLGQTLEKAGDTGAAFACYREALEQNVADPALFDGLDRLANAQGGAEARAVVWRQVANRQRTPAEAWRRLAGALDEMGDKEGAGKARKLALDAEGDQGAAWNAALALAGAGDIEGAIERCREAASAPTQAAELLVRLGLELAEAEAAAVFEAAIDADPAFFAAYDHLDQLCERRGGPDARVAQWQRCVQAHGDVSRAHFMLGRALDAQGDFSGASLAYEKACELTPNDAAMQAALGVARVNAGAARDALEPLRRALQINPGIASIRPHLVRALTAAGERVAACEEARRCASDNIPVPEDWARDACADGALAPS